MVVFSPSFLTRTNTLLFSFFPFLLFIFSIYSKFVPICIKQFL
jgi:uncharacterized BrkB/YihY/UPF0761 family membrane protein